MFEYKDLHFSVWFLKLITWTQGFTRCTLKMHTPYILPPAAVPNVPPCFKLMSLSYIHRHSTVYWSCVFFLCGQSISAALHKPPQVACSAILYIFSIHRPPSEVYGWNVPNVQNDGRFVRWQKCWKSFFPKFFCGINPASLTHKCNWNLICRPAKSLKPIKRLLNCATIATNWSA